MRCYRKILHIPYKDQVANEEVHAKIQQTSGPHKDLLTIVKRCKLQWYGHVSCSSGLAKTILQGTVKRGRKQGRQRKRLEDNIREWIGLEFSRSQRVVENRENGENWLRNHLWCPTNPHGLGIDNDNDDEFQITKLSECVPHMHWLVFCFHCFGGRGRECSTNLLITSHCQFC